MSLHRATTQREGIGDCTVAQTLEDQLENLTFGMADGRALR
jgi:hypothetical protein